MQTAISFLIIALILLLCFKAWQWRKYYRAGNGRKVIYMNRKQRRDLKFGRASAVVKTKKKTLTKIQTEDMGLCSYSWLTRAPESLCSSTDSTANSGNREYATETLDVKQQVKSILAVR